MIPLKTGLQIALFVAVFSLSGSAMASSCGNGSVQSTEECDDGNNIDGDGCNSICLKEFCGDGIPQTASGETCDDKNAVNGDGCSACQTDEAWFCVGVPSICAIATPPTKDPPVEAEGTPEAPKPSSPSELGFISEIMQKYHSEPEYKIEEYSSQYAYPYVPPEYCGDGIKQEHLGEQCDDGNKAEDDGCNSLCQSTFQIRRTFFPRFDFLKLNKN